ncbi:histone acetyltransferase KAT6A-like [Oppia nitens]|uniref:histone acetyltransferase KAT6A-like n=1 Tax=Oppia nitens TaxID=1686743 RepID=UPI0023DA58F4|nr:histone acetyltransferase KAT6A-like [Oppia nitens]
MSSSEKSASIVSKDRTRMIISAIDCLKGRKARPDETKICNFVEKRFGVNKQEIIAAIKDAVIEGSVLKVKYKDSVSYRNPLKFNQKMSNHIMSSTDTIWNISPQTMKRFVRELRVLCRQRRDGVTRHEIIESLKKNCHFKDHNESLVDRLLCRSIQTGTIKQLSSGYYIVMFGKRFIGSKRRPQQCIASDKVLNKNNINDKSDCNKNVNVAKELLLTDPLSPNRKKAVPVMTRERPVSKRKKFKKSLGPDFIVSSEKSSPHMRDSFEPKCDFCHLKTKFTKRGENEESLTCKDCSARAHPSCMGYSRELAERSSLSPWQCMDCKTCNICHDSRDGENMLVCDFCDKGFHMNCHIPMVQLKPIGKWECNDCNTNKSSSKTYQNNDNNKSNEETDTKRARVIYKRNSETSCSSSSFVSNSKENYSNGYPDIIPNPQKWSADEVSQFICDIGFPEQSILFKEQEIDGTSLLLLRRSDVLTGFHMKLGPALKIYSHIMRLQKND